MEGLKCPACNAKVKLSFTIADMDRSDWIFCSCGSVFHQKQLDKEYWKREYAPKYREWKCLRERYAYIERVYLPIVEELTLLRRFLDVGFGAEYHIQNMENRGWLTQGIDIVDNDYITADFEEHDFGLDRFDFIKMGNVIGCFKEPLKGLYKAKELLNDKGLVLIMAPDAELIYQKGMFDWGNWQWQENWIVFSERQMLKILDVMGFDVIVRHKQTSKRFISWNYFHILAQKRDA